MSGSSPGRRRHWRRSDDSDSCLRTPPSGIRHEAGVRRLRVGYLKAAFSNTNQSHQTDANDAAALEKIGSLGASFIPVELPEHASVPFRAIQWSEMNAALKDPVHTRPDELIRQDRIVNMNGVRLLPASDYLDANRVRSLLMREMARIMSEVDVYVAPFDYADYTPNPVATLNTAVTNLTGQPAVILPHGFNEKGQPTSLTFVGRVFGEAETLALAKAYQDATDWHLKHPPL